MKKETAYRLWRSLLARVRNGEANRDLENPALTFNRQLRTGKFDDMPMEEFEAMRDDALRLQSVWMNEASRSAGEVLLGALQKTDISIGATEMLVRLLARCSENSKYAADEGEDTGASPANGLPPAWQLAPRAIYDKLNEMVWGQYEAKRAAAMLYYNMIRHRLRSNSVFCGPTGCGKSEIWRCMAKLFPGRIRIIDASRMSADGWRGSVHLRSVFEDVSPDILNSGMIVVLDEADKVCCETAISAGGTNVSYLVQNSMLKMMDGDTLEFDKEDGKKAFSVDCSRVSVVLLGAFETLMKHKSKVSGGGIGFGAPARVVCDYANSEITHEDLIQAGMRPEIAGRIARIVPLQPLGFAEYRSILTDFVLRDLEAATETHIRIDDASVDHLAERAEATGLGVRWMKSQLLNAIDRLTFDNPDTGTYVLSFPAGAREGNAPLPPREEYAPAS